MKKINDNPKQKLYIGVFIFLYIIFFIYFLIRPILSELNMKRDLKSELENKEYLISNFTEIVSEKEKDNNELANNIYLKESNIINDDNFESFLYELNSANKEDFNIMNIEVLNRIDNHKENMDYILLNIKAKGNIRELLDFFDAFYDDYKNIIFEEIEIIEDDGIFVMDCNMAIYL